jgi:hypothetical protein
LGQARREFFMAIDFSETKMFGAAPFEAFVTVTASTTKGLQAITAEIMDYSKQYFEKSRVLFERLARVKKIDEAIELQSDFAKSAFEDYVAQATRMGQIYTSLATDSFKPINAASASRPSDATPPSVTAPQPVSTAPSKAPVAAKQNGSSSG